MSVARTVPSLPAVQAMSDAALVDASGTIAAARRELEARAGWVAAEIARRSRRELGHGGLAQRQGFRTPEALLQNITGSTRADAVALVRVGTMVADTDAADALATATATDTVPGHGLDPEGSHAVAGSAPETDANHWRVAIARAVGSGLMSYAQADAIRIGLGEPTPTITGDVLADAAAVLVDAATDPDALLTVDELRRLARQMRDSIDADGLLEQEKAQQDDQYIKAWRRADGMVGGSVLLDRDNGAFFLSIIDQLTSPRRGGPRFVDASDSAQAQKLVDDVRSTERIAADGVMQLLRIGVDADPGTVYVSRRPAVRVVVTEDTLTGGTGSASRGFIEDTGESISVSAIHRHICDSGTVPVTTDSHGRPLDVGRDQRLFTARQKTALAIRDGGCRMPGCDRPPSWTESHHIDHFVEHRGRTDTEDGILLCRYHHLSLHNNNWRILRSGDRYHLRKSPYDVPGQVLIELHGKNPLTRLRKAREHSADHHTRVSLAGEAGARGVAPGAIA